MITVAGVRFRKAGKIYYFDPVGIELEAQQHVIVETVRGIEYGTVVLPSKEVQDKDVVQPLKKVLRVATPEDDEKEFVNRDREREAYDVCLSKIRKHKLSMKLIDCEYTFDNNKLLFYFTADGRVDFRELVKDLASVFKTRIELRQIGVRDETKMMGSIGICGRTLCCHAHLSDFHPVSIKMAKDQNLSLNPTKISGVCGRLMCCLKYEEETYRELNKNLPRVGEKVRIKETGILGDVINTNIIRQRVKMVVRKPEGDTEVVELKLEELDLKSGGKFASRPAKQQVAVDSEDAKALRELEMAERKEKTEARKASEGNKQKSQSNRGRNNQKNQQRQDGNKKSTAKDTSKGDKKQAPQKKAQPKAAKVVEGKQGTAEKKKEGGNRRNRRPRNRNNQTAKKDGGATQKPTTKE